MLWDCKYCGGPQDAKPVAKRRGRTILLVILAAVLGIVSVVAVILLWG
jgi:hypothetical protein